MSFILAEDKALRDLLLGMTVTDQKSVTEIGPTRQVEVWFGQPDQEIRDQKYPYITIDLVDVGEDFSRAMRGKVKPTYLADPDTIGSSTSYDPDDHSWEIDFPIPVNLDYQITTYARQPRHDRQILAQLMYTRIPLRFAVLNTGDNTPQNTTRRLDVLDIAKRDVSENGKRLFVNAITVRVSSEIAQSTYTKLYKALELNITGVSDTEGNQNPRGPFSIIDSITIP